ncbi:MAG: DUF2155 domain-containing protein [Alphaproteobacteria bacterium]|nr:DUF2155 domain-containing protein [Alphaproteobacteria bacterium]
MACVAAQAARAQMIDDKMMPPVLVAPPVPAINDAQDDFQPENNDIIAPLSILQVPVLDIPDDDEIDGDVRPMLVGTFSLLHKVTAKVQQIQLLSGQEYAIGDMSLTMHDCLSTPPEEPPETKAFLQISEFKAGRDKPLFNGWMFASSPGINAMDHPVFDIWPLACKTENGMVFTGEILPPVSDANVVATP